MSVQNNVKLLQQLKSSFKRTINISFKTFKKISFKNNIFFQKYKKVVIMWWLMGETLLINSFLKNVSIVLDTKKARYIVVDPLILYIAIVAKLFFSFIVDKLISLSVYKRANNYFLYPIKCTLFTWQIRIDKIF